MKKGLQDAGSQLSGTDKALFDKIAPSLESASSK